jgi:transposase
MAKPLLSDEVWEQIRPMLPAPKPRRARFPGRKPLDPRRVLTGIVFVLKTGIPWEELPVEMGCGCGMTCLNYLKTWQQNGLWAKMHEILQAHVPGADRIDWSRVARDGLPGPKPVVAVPAQPSSNGGPATPPPDKPASGGGFFPGGGREHRWTAPLVAPSPMM